MKKILKYFLLWIFVFFVTVIPTLAVDDFIGTDKAKVVAGGVGYSNLEESQFVNTVGTVINVVLSFVGMLFLVFMIYAGFLWMTARGEDEQIKKATGIIKNSLIGLIILLSSYAISNFIIARVNK